MGLQIARMSRLINLDFTLQLMEQESKGKGAEEIRQLWDYVKGKTNGKS